MSVTSNLYAVLSLNTVAGPNQPSTSDVYSATATTGTYSAGPIAVAVTSTPTALPLSTTVSMSVAHIVIVHTGSPTAPNLIVDMRNAAGQSSKVTLSPGGRIYLFNGTVTTASATGYADYSQWMLSVAGETPTTASVTLVYT